MKILRNRTTVPLLAALVAAILILPATAQACRGGGPHGPDRCIARNADELGVDDATVEKIEAIVAAAREEAAPLREAVRAAREEMRTLLDADQPDEAAVMAQADEVSAAMAAMHKQRLATLLKIRALLTPEQRDKLKGMCGPGHRGGRGGGPGPGALMGPGPDGDMPCGATAPPCGGPGTPCSSSSKPCGAGSPPCGGPLPCGADRS